MNEFPPVKRGLIAALDAGRAMARAFVETLPPRPLTIHSA